MVYKIISIKEELCNGCGECIIPCQNNVIKIVGKKAKIVSDMVCKNLGNCIPICPLGAIIAKEVDVTHESMPVASEFERERIKAVL